MEQKEEYNVIWIDDEWDTIGKAFIQICEKRHNISRHSRLVERAWMP